MLDIVIIPCSIDRKIVISKYIMLDVYKNTTNINTDDTTDCKSLSLFVSPARNRFQKAPALSYPHLQGVPEYLTPSTGCSRILDTIYRVF